MDAGGIDACKPHYRAAKATYVQLVDSRNELGDALGFRVVPNGFLVDEAGVLKVQRIGGFEASSPATLKMIEDFLSQPKAMLSSETPSAPSFFELRRAAHESGSAESRLAYGKELLNRKQHWEALPHLRHAAINLPHSASAQFALGSCLLAIGLKSEATLSLRKALRLDPENYVIRKQIWVIEHPERFNPEIDWAWQREQLAKERSSGG